MVDYYLLNTVPRMFHLQEWQAITLSDERVLWNFRIRTKSGRPHTLRLWTTRTLLNREREACGHRKRRTLFGPSPGQVSSVCNVNTSFRMGTRSEGIENFAASLVVRTGRLWRKNVMES